MLKSQVGALAYDKAPLQIWAYENVTQYAGHARRVIVPPNLWYRSVDSRLAFEHG